LTLEVPRKFSPYSQPLNKPFCANDSVEARSWKLEGWIVTATVVAALYCAVVRFNHLLLSAILIHPPFKQHAESLTYYLLGAVSVRLPMNFCTHLDIPQLCPR
jgi:hypothetical protein